MTDSESEPVVVFDMALKELERLAFKRFGQLLMEWHPNTVSYKQAMTHMTRASTIIAKESQGAINRAWIKAILIERFDKEWTKRGYAR